MKDGFDISENREWLDENLEERVRKCIGFKKNSGKKKPYLSISIADEIVEKLRIK